MKTKAIIDTYAFDDMTIKVIIDPDKAEVYKEITTGLFFVFAVDRKDLADIDIEALHENGYFDGVEDGEDEGEE